MKMKFTFLCFLLVFVTTAWGDLPVSDANLVIYLDASLITGVANGNPISTWQDQSGNNNDATQPTSGIQPLYIASDSNFHGWPVVHFDGDDYMVLPSTCINVGSFTMFAAGQYDSIEEDNNMYICNGQDGSGDDRIRFQLDTTSPPAWFEWRAGSSGWKNIMYTPADMNVHIFSETSTVEGFLDGTSIGTASNTSTENPTAFNLGSYNRGEKDHLIGDIAEFIVYNRVLNSAEIASTNQYLIDKYFKGIPPGLGLAHDPDPVNGAENAGSAKDLSNVEIDLKWKTGMDPCDTNNVDPNITGHQIYLAALDVNLGYGQPGQKIVDTNISVGSPPNDANYYVPNLDYNTVYHWRVDELVLGSHPNDPATRIGYEWSFTTLGKDPAFEDQPDDTLADIGDEVIFSVNVKSATDVTYQWYKSDDADIGSDTQIGSDQNSYTISSVASGDDAYYYVNVTNDANSVNSNVVHLWLEREIARYKLEDDLTSSETITVFGGSKTYNAEWDAAYGSPNVPAGADYDPCHIEGSYSVRFNNDVNAFISVPNSEDYFNHYVVGLTVNCWARDMAASDNHALVSKHALSTTGSEEVTDWEGWTLQIINGNPRFEVRHGGVNVSQSVGDSDWHMVTAVYDPNNGVARLYVDAELNEAEDDEGLTPGDVKKSPDDRLAIGSVDTNDGSYHVNPFDGYIDDVRIWTYPLDGLDIAKLYIDTYGDYHNKGSICVDDVHPTYDYDDDCDNDLADFAKFAEKWLECYLYPESECGKK